jgi:hypothetical protein
MTNNILLNLEENTTFLSAKELARTAGATKPQVIYWAKAGYLERREDGYYMFPLSQVPKAKVMGILTNSVGLDAERASRLSTRLLARFDDAPDAAKAVLVFLDALSDHLDEVMDLMIGTEFHKAVLESLVASDEGSKKSDSGVISERLSKSERPNG